ncbi:hypothetical protein F0562_012791 [Nyssa sinensis]|uniref:Legumain prodomain domain-containing protein n=1 Tax=Nyssa sinensis TaxID=561372 RepID=A0A5J4ZT28_9ASTE|nr:hypothetical protein F0562_012791 [Nyssa sinensis]
MYYDGSDESQIFELCYKATHIKQSGRPIPLYFTKLKSIWQELDKRRPIKMICAADIKVRQEELVKDCVYDFLAGLDDRFDKVCSDLLRMKPLPGLGESFAYVRREAQRQTTMLGLGGDVGDPSVAMVSKALAIITPRIPRPSVIENKDALHCKFCNGNRHTEDTCFKKHGFPEWNLERRKQLKAEWAARRPGHAKTADAGVGVASVAASEFGDITPVSGNTGLVLSLVSQLSLSDSSEDASNLKTVLIVFDVHDPGMPNMPFLFGKDLIEVLKKKHASGSYKEMVIYVEACESGSVFEGMMPDDLNIYVTTASNAEESSWGTYCPGMEPAPPPEYITCLGDLYSVSWMEDSETHNLQKETIEQQYQAVKDRTSNYNTYNAGSHVMEYGNKSIKAERVYLYQGFDPATENLPPDNFHLDTHMDVVNQRDADLLFLWQWYKKSKDGSEKKKEILQQIKETMMHRVHLDGSMDMIGVLLFGLEKGSSTLGSVRASGLPIVDDWECLKSMVRLFESHCGSLTQYGMKHMRAFANICNNGVSQAAMEDACMAACSGHISRQWNPSKQGYSA